MSDFSNLAGNGAAYYLAALGRRVRAPDETGVAFLWSGTSFSAPVISGAVALLAQQFPTLTGAQIVDLLLRTAVDVGAVGTDATFGRGVLDIARAFAPQGSASLAGSAIAVSTTATTATLSTAMGNPTQGSLGTLILDSYGRAFDYDLGRSIHASPVSAKLASALALGTRNVSVSGKNTAIAFSVAENSSTTSLDRLLLSPHEQHRARALAGSVISRLGEGTIVALGLSEGASALSEQLQSGPDANFLISRSADQDWGFETKVDTGFAVRHTLGPISLTASAETGNAQLWQSRDTEAVRSGYRSYDYGAFSLGADRKIGPVTLTARATHLIESQTVLGARFVDLIGNHGARSWFADVDVVATPAPHWRLHGAIRKGWTSVNAGGLRQGNDQLLSSAWSFDVRRDALLRPGDSLALRITQPLRVSKGGLNLTLPSGYDYFSQQATMTNSLFNLAPQGRELDIETVYSRPLLGGYASGNVYWRKQPGNISNAPNDVGAAIRLSFGL